MISIKIEDKEALNDPVGALSELLARTEFKSKDSPENRKYIRLTGWIEEDDRDDARTTLWEAFVHDFDVVVQRITDEWGAPDFRGAYDEPGYPEELFWAPHLAYWVRGNRVAYVVCEQQDNETPLELYLSALPTERFHPRRGPLMF